MTDSSAPSDDRHAHLRTYAAMQKQATVDRLKQAIVKLEAESRPVTTFTIKEVSGLDYMAYYRNREAFALFQQHSTHLQKAREKEQAKQRGPRRPSKRKDAKDREALPKGKVSPRDPLLDYKRPRLVELLHEARAERDQIKQRAQEDFAQMEQRYHALLQERMQCGLTIARLEAQVAEYLAFMNRFRTSLQREEHGPAT